MCVFDSMESYHLHGMNSFFPVSSTSSEILDAYLVASELPRVDNETINDGFKLFRCSMKSDTSYGLILAPGMYNLAFPMAPVIEMTRDTAILLIYY